MKYVFVSKRGDILPLAQRIENEGNQVDVYVCATEELLVERHLTNDAPDIIVFDSSGFGKLAHRLSRLKFPIIGGSLLSDQLASDSRYSEKVLKMCGLPTAQVSGIDVQIDLWFNGKTFMNHVYCIDSVVSIGTSQDKVFALYLSKLVSALKKAEYLGPVSLKASFTKDSVSFSSLFAQFATPTMLAFKEGLKGRVSNIFQSMVQGQNRTFMFKPGYILSVYLSLSPKTLFSESLQLEVEASGITEDTLKHLWLYGFSKKGGDTFIYRGTGDIIAVVTARGDTIREARRRAYRTIYNLKIPGMVFLQKVGKNATLGYSNLKQWGWIL